MRISIMISILDYMTRLALFQDGKLFSQRIHKYLSIDKQTLVCMICYSADQIKLVES